MVRKKGCGRGSHVSRIRTRREIVNRRVDTPVRRANEGRISGNFSGGDAGLTRVALESFFRDVGLCWNSGWIGWQEMFGFAFGSGVGFGPGEEFAEIAVEIGCNRRSGIADFLNDCVFHS
jgi:hypothetical protein